MLLLLSSAHAFGDEPGPDSFGTFMDESGKWQYFQPSYERWLPMHHRRPNVLRSSAESIVLIGVGTA